ncbi:hypothetical protein [Aeromonas sp. FDAARGOS 1402]|uniref:hypothetical protein n=1 Tax=Aeromonas sp. FDAARGOS 1402 TaxID=2778051 RepID=UPI001C21B301|nr:hypothetical protein [Aeromonas sp. FDAARGOS 1402]QWZ56675.1 hypothetical protein I6L32_22630 [Aeromonas sp. FDAARGOS 1402]
MNRNLQNTADQLRLWLTANGCKVRTGQVRDTPLLMVTGPLPPEMTGGPCGGASTWLGGQRGGHVRFGGCLLHWRQ